MKKFLIYFTVFLCLIFCLSCSPVRVVPKPIALPKPEQKEQTANEEQTVATEKKEKPGVEALPMPSFEKPAEKPVEKSVTDKAVAPKEPIDLRKINLAPKQVSLNVQKMPLSDFIIYALGETLKVPFVMDEKTMNDKQLVTLMMPQTMPSDKAFITVIELLEKYSLYLEEKAGTLYILSKPPQPPPPAPYAVRFGLNVVDGQAEIIQVVPLKHTSLYEMQQLLLEVTRTKITIKPYHKGNILLLYGRADEIKRVMEVLETFDVPYFENKKMFLLRLTYMRAEDFITEIKSILSGLGFRTGSPPNEMGPMLIPIRQLNGVLLVSPDEKTSKLIIEWKERLDTAESAGAEERAYSFIPQYSKASDLVKSIQNLYGGGLLADTSAGQKAGTQKTSAAVASSMPAGMKVSADDGKNVILIVSTPVNYKIIQRLLKDLDTPPKQVLIEVTIVEVTLTGALKYGVEWYIRDTQQGGQYTLGTLGKLGLSSLGLTYAFISQTGNFQALVSALASQNLANILSTPRLMVLDNKDATIQVGSDIPTVTGEVSTTTTSTLNNNILRNITYRSTGIMLKVRPTINAEGLVTLEINQEVSQPGAPGVGDSPIILTRRIGTTVVAGHGQTIALGGLFNDNQGEAETKVPLLGDIPLLGNLFKYTSKTSEKTELLVLVTATIITSTDEAVTITNELKKELKSFNFSNESKP
jgi:general secretion pathway protein D